MTARGKVTRDDQLSCSQLPAVMGESPWQTANDALARCFDAVAGVEPEDIGNESMAWGSRLELPILEEAARRLGLTLEHGFETAFQAKELPLACSLDGKLWLPSPEPVTLRTDPDKGIFVLTDGGTLTVSTEGIAEAKLTANAPDDAPPLYRGPLQLQGQMLCTGLIWGCIATLFRGTELRIYVFAAHEGTQEAIRKAAWDFNTRVMSYAHTGNKDWFQLASPKDGATVFKDSKPVTIALPDKADLVRQLIEAKAMSKAAEQMEAAATTALMEAMGEAEQAEVGAYVVTWGSRSYKAQPEKVVPAKEAYTIRAKTLTVRGVA